MMCDVEKYVDDLKLFVTQINETDLSPCLWQELQEVATKITVTNCHSILYTPKCMQLFDNLQLFGNDHQTIHYILDTRDKILGKT